MTRHHMTVDGLVPFTQDEEDFRDLEEASSLAEKPMRNWKEKMVMSDGPLPRWAEDLIDLTAGAPTYGSISPQTQKLADDKKTLRATKPE